MASAKSASSPRKAKGTKGRRSLVEVVAAPAKALRPVSKAEARRRAAMLRKLDEGDDGGPIMAMPKPGRPPTKAQQRAAWAVLSEIYGETLPAA